MNKIWAVEPQEAEWRLNTMFQAAILFGLYTLQKRTGRYKWVGPVCIGLSSPYIKTFWLILVSQYISIYINILTGRYARHNYIKTGNNTTGLYRRGWPIQRHKRFLCFLLASLYKIIICVISSIHDEQVASDRKPQDISFIFITVCFVSNCNLSAIWYRLYHLSFWLPLWSVYDFTSMSDRTEELKAVFR